MSWLVRVQADDFFKAYQVLAKNRPELNSPAVVNLAFALELYIKDIYYALKMEDQFPRGRDGKCRDPKTVRAVWKILTVDENGQHYFLGKPVTMAISGSSTDSGTPAVSGDIP